MKSIIRVLQAEVMFYILIALVALAVKLLGLVL
jgi:hypothetical protein